MKSENKKSFAKEYLITSAISLAFGTGIFCLFFFTVKPDLAAAYDSAMITGLILLCIGGILFVTREGFFDIFAYGFKQFGNMLFARKANKDNDYQGYLELKKQQRANKSKYYLFICLVGVAFVTAFIILRLMYEYSI